MAITLSDSGASREVCALFADVADSTRLYEVLGDREACRIIGDCVTLMDAATGAHRGYTVQLIGDEILAAFSSAEEGAVAAEDMMRRVECQGQTSGVGLALRIGFHYGPVVVERSELLGGRMNIFGDTVNTAARIVALAKARQILTSAATLERLPEHWRSHSRLLDTFNLKGKSEDIAICEIMWREPREVTVMSTIPGLAGGAGFACFELTHRDRRYTLEGPRAALTLGRATGSDVLVDDPQVSREHARIEARRGKFVLIDKSSNGTYVTFEGAVEVPLRREEIILHGSGHISLGRTARNHPAAVVLTFRVL